MRKIKNIFIMLLAMVLLVTSCQDESHELGEILAPSQINFEVVQDYSIDEGGNTVILKNNTPETVSIWDYGTGRSTRQQDTIRFAFKGEYVIKFSAVTAGGVVEMEPVTIEVTDDNLMYVNDPMWTALSGGVGQEKTWLLDVDANGVSKYFTSPVYFSGNKIGWHYECTEDPAPAECWLWEPELAGNSWIADPGDYGTMTFNLKGGPFVTVNHKINPYGTQNGTYFLDANAKTITLTDVKVLQNTWASNDVENWTDGTIISLTEDAMQLAFRHKAKAEFMIFNYISKDYADAWVPEGPAEDPNFDHGDQQEIVAVSTSKTWKFDLQVPYNWAGLEGDFLNNWNSRADIVATGWAPYGDADVANIDNSSVTFYADGKVVVAQDDGSTEEGTYTIDEEKNIITFEGVTPTLPIAGWVTATTTEENQWKIVKVERSDITDAVTGIWFGKRDPAKAEYMVFHFVLR
jgi:hypothetical protein